MTSARVKKASVDDEDPDPTDEYILRGAEQYTQLLDTADPKAISIYLSLWKASNAQFRANARAIDALDLDVSVSGSKLTILRTLYFAPAKQMQLSELSKVTGMSRALITHLLNGLAKGALITRLGSAHDRRVMIAQLTDAGEVAFHRVLPVISNRMTEACEDFTEEEKDTLLRLLQRLF